MLEFRLKIHRSLFLKSPINNILALVQIMAWCRAGNKLLSETTRVRLFTHFCVTRPQWVDLVCLWPHKMIQRHFWVPWQIRMGGASKGQTLTLRLDMKVNTRYLSQQGRSTYSSFNGLWQNASIIRAGSKRRPLVLITIMKFIIKSRSHRFYVIRRMHTKLAREGPV